MSDEVPSELREPRQVDPSVWCALALLIAAGLLLRHRWAWLASVFLTSAAAAIIFLEWLSKVYFVIGDQSEAMWNTALAGIEFEIATITIAKIHLD